MRQRKAEKSRITLTSKNIGTTKLYDRILFGIGLQQSRQEYEKTKQEDTDTIERKEIHIEIKRLIGYGLPEKEVVERLTEKFPNSKYKEFFNNWVND